MMVEVGGDGFELWEGLEFWKGMDLAERVEYWLVLL